MDGVSWGLPIAAATRGLFYNTDLFERESIVRLGEHYRRLLAAVVEEPDCPVSRLALMSEHERHRLLVEWNETDAAYPRDRCIHTLFEEQVERSPEAVAVEFENIGNGLVKADPLAVVIGKKCKSTRY